ncbi:Imm15 family immunity protein [Neisseria sp. 83E34]|uniref:Imm15 family immunity protein n=1 Tax=Neisseria sp. 83E34 TaxID=1692264 RepID=UPI0006CE7926|nr:Imm15 family immunity protein [Neisseria sp. 83E34]KPN70574.1 hypothetical protein AKG09_11450 [Neisseria sp. 83E34]
MDYLKLLNTLAKKEKSYQEDNIIDLLTYPVEFEEIPLITRVGRETPFLGLLPKENLNSFFLNAAIFYLNNIKITARKILNEKELNNLFFCITYPDANQRLFDLYNFYIPNLCITKMKYKESFENQTLLNLDKTPWLKNSLIELGYKNTFKPVYSRFNDDFEDEIFRIFLLNTST